MSSYIHIIEVILNVVKTSQIINSDLSHEFSKEKIMRSLD